MSWLKLDTVNKKILAGLLAAIIAGGAAGYLGAYIANPQAGQNIINMDKNGAERTISGARDTYVVRAVEKSGPAVVGISSQVYERDIFNRPVAVGEGVGSGVLYDTEGHIITNNHVVAQSNGQVQVSLSNGQVVSGLVIGRDEQTDLAVIKIDPPENIKPISLGSSSDLHVGEPAIAIGNPLGLEFQGSVTVGVISALSRTIDAAGQRFPLLQTDAAINPGNSGGALLNAEGELIGINSSKIAKEGVEGMGFAIPIDEAKQVVDSIIENGKVVRPYLGIYALDKASAQEYGYRFEGSGLLVVRIDPNGPAASLGLGPGDLLTGLDGQSITSLMDLKETLDKHRPGDSVAIEFVHQGKAYKKTIEIGISD